MYVVANIHTFFETCKKNRAFLHKNYDILSILVVLFGVKVVLRVILRPSA
jgi:hypothetical protein